MTPVNTKLWPGGEETAIVRDMRDTARQLGIVDLLRDAQRACTYQDEGTLDTGTARAVITEA